MSKRTVLVVVMAVLVCSLGLTGSALAAEFSADMMSLQGGQETLSKAFFKNSLYRMEMNQEGQTSITIGNTVERVVWVLDPEARIYLELKGEQAQSPGVADVDDDLVEEVKDLGTETIDGYTCDKTQIVYKDPDMGVMTIWFSPKLQVALRMEYPNESMTIEYRNIKEAPQPDSLFTIPQGYTKMSIPGM